ncbi:MAG TPA: hypothetical protein VJ242_03580 [Patescibacteria group bacterium]|nr:hypothetical protein [Patescibacteria group bacterium]
MGKIKAVPAGRQGFTLIEIITVAGLMTLFALTIISIFLATLRGGNKAQLIQRVHQDGDYALNTIAGTIRNSTAVDCSDGLVVTAPTGAQITFSLVDDGGIVRVASDSSYFLTGNVSSASDFSASCYQSYLGNQVVSVRFTLTAGQAVGAQVAEKLSQEFATSVATRQQ